MEKPSFKKNSTIDLWFIIIGSIAIHIMAIIANKTFFKGKTWAHEPFHSAVEISGSWIALFVGYFLINLKKDDSYLSRINYLLASAFISMGVIDGFHSMVHVGKTFVWLHSCATLIGGLLFASVWLPKEKSFSKRKNQFVLFSSTIFSLLFSVASIIWSDLIPPMVKNGQFTMAAQFLNIFGGVLFLFAAIKLILIYKQTHERDIFLFFLHCILFGAAAIMFETSRLWDSAWWGWHILRFLAYAVALYYTLLSFDKKIETDLKSSDIRGANLFNCIEKQSIYSKTNYKGIIVEANENFCQISKYKKEELIGKDHRILNSGEHSSDFFKKMWQTISSGKTWVGDIKNKAKDGSYYWVATTITPEVDIEGNIIGFISLRNDITEEIKVKRESVEKIKELEEILSFSPIGIFKTDPEGQCIYTNETWQEIAGMDAKQSLGGNWVKAIHPEDNEMVFTAWDKAVKENRPFELEYRFKNQKTGVDSIVFGQAKAIFNEKNEIKSYLGVISNISKRKQYEKELEEERIKLIQSSKMATLGEMAAGIAHEINNPLAIILGCAGLMESGKLDQEKTASSIDRVKKSVERIAKIVDGLRKFSRTTEKVDKKEVQIQQLLAESVTLMEAKSKNNGVKIVNNVKESKTLLIDEIQIEQILVNLISNAIDENSEKPEAWVELNHKSDNNFEQIIVRDSGKGINEETVKKLFNPFYTTKEIGKGTGLGLSISKGIALEHQGDLEYQLLDGHTAFVLKIPKYHGA